jgi:hypothetical protein
MKLIYMAGAALVVSLWSLVVMVCYWIIVALEGTVESLGAMIGLGWLADLAGDATQVLLIIVWLAVSGAIFVAAWLVAAGKSALLRKLFGRSAKYVPPMPQRFRK